MTSSEFYDARGKITEIDKATAGLMPPIRTIRATTSIIPTIFMLDALPATALPICRDMVAWLHNQNKLVIIFYQKTRMHKIPLQKNVSYQPASSHFSQLND